MCTHMTQHTQCQPNFRLFSYFTGCCMSRQKRYSDASGHMTTAAATAITGMSIVHRDAEETPQLFFSNLLRVSKTALCDH